jgi:predicted DNA-binding transcriptional regulator AlpA
MTGAAQLEEAERYLAGPEATRQAYVSRTKAMRDEGELPRILNAKQVRAMLGVSQTTLWRMVNVQRCFPRPTPISAHRVGWREADVKAWIGRRFGDQPSEE